MIAPINPQPAERAPGTIDHPTESRVFREAVACARHMSPDALAAWRDVLTLDLADDDPVFPGPTGRHLAGECLRAVDAELARRERLARIAGGVGTPADRAHQDWRELARVVSERTDLPELLALCGVALTLAGFNSRRGAPEFSAACPACSGQDRLRVWGGPYGRAWCRVCGWSADAIAVAQSLLPGCRSFRDAVRALASIVVTGPVQR